MQNIKDCPICGAQTPFYPDHGRMVVFYECPVCGRFELSPLEQINKNHLASYLVYNAFLSSDVIEYRYHTGLEKEICDQYRKEFDEGIHMNRSAMFTVAFIKFLSVLITDFLLKTCMITIFNNIA